MNRNGRSRHFHVYRNIIAATQFPNFLFQVGDGLTISDIDYVISTTFFGNIKLNDRGVEMGNILGPIIVGHKRFLTTDI